MPHKSNFLELCFANIFYYSKRDEDAFFEWLNKLTFVESWYGSGNAIYIKTKKKLSREDLRELLALAYRFKVKDMTQFAQFLNKSNKEWFYDNNKAYWHRRVFKTKQKT